MQIQRLLFRRLAIWNRQWSDEDAPFSSALGGVTVDVEHGPE